MTIRDLNVNRLVHLYLAFLGGLLCWIGIAEAYLLWGQPALFAWACGAAAGGYWFERRMVRHSKRIKDRIRSVTQVVALYEALDAAFENALKQTRGDRPAYPRGIFHKRAA